MAGSPTPPRPLLTLGAPPHGLGAALSVRGRPPCFGALDGEALARLGEEIPRALARGGMIVPGEDAALSATERRLGMALGELLRGPGMDEIARRLERLRAEAELAGAPLDLLLDLRGAALWALPWELLELLPRDAPLGGGRVVRVVEGARASLPSGGGLEVVVWSPTPEDPDCARVLDALERTLARHPALRRARPEGAPEGTRVAHVVCHGGERGEPVLELGGERSLDAATFGRVLAPLVGGAALVVLDVCGAASAGELAALPAWRVVDAGAAACLAPRATLDVEASIALSGALYGALARGEPLLSAAQESRRAVAALGLPDPSARWWSVTLVCADPGALDLAPARPGPVALAVAARASQDAAALLEDASKLSSAQGFLGLEHLALALARRSDLPPLLALAQPQLAVIGARASGFQPTGLGEPGLTPRLTSLLETLPEGFDRLTLLRAVASSRPFRLEAPGLAGLLRDLGPVTATLSGEAPPPRAPLPVVDRSLAPRLMVLGGPEDGRTLSPSTERPLIGRWDPLGEQPEVTQLYVEAGATDPTLSRRHLRWLGGAMVEILGASSLRRAGVSVPVDGILTLRQGDLLELGSATRLEVLSVPP